MTSLSEEILKKYQVRKTKAQKTRFIEFMQSKLPGTESRGGGFPRCRNLDPGRCGEGGVYSFRPLRHLRRSAFPQFYHAEKFSYKHPLQPACQYSLFCPDFWADLLLGRFDLGFWTHELLSLSLFFLFLYFVLSGGRANPHTANDNTSGVVALCELMEALSGEELARTAFVFFDHEESGLFGSAFSVRSIKSA